MKHNPNNPDWFNRDRFILSAGHASMLMYSLLYLFGYGLTTEDLGQFRQWQAKRRVIQNIWTPRALK